MCLFVCVCVCVCACLCVFVFVHAYAVLEITVKPLAIFQPISAFSRPKSILIGQISHMLSMGQQSVAYKISYLQKNGQPISDSYF